MTTLEKIRAEITELFKISGVSNSSLCFAVLDLIDKYAEQEPKILDTIDFAIDASNGDTNYFVGFRNGLRYAKSLVDGEEPQYESCAEQEQTGKWEKVVKEHKCYARDDTYTTTEYHCSECGAEPFVNEDGFYEFSNYCPSCGAKMESEENNG